MRLIRDPVGGLAPAYEELGPLRAFGVGLVFAVTFSLAATTGVHALLPGWIQLDASDLVSLLLLCLLPPAVLALSGLAVRTVAGRSGTLASDAFYTASSLLPLALAALAVGLLGLSNGSLSAVLLGTAACLSVLMLFGGATRLSSLSEGVAAFAVPLMIIITAWISQAVVMRMLF